MHVTRLIRERGRRNTEFRIFILLTTYGIRGSVKAVREYLGSSVSRVESSSVRSRHETLDSREEQRRPRTVVGAPRSSESHLGPAGRGGGSDFCHNVLLSAVSDLELILHKTLKRKQAATCVGMQTKAATVVLAASRTPGRRPGP